MVELRWMERWAYRMSAFRKSVEAVWQRLPLSTPPSRLLATPARGPGARQRPDLHLHRTESAADRLADRGWSQ